MGNKTIGGCSRGLRKAISLGLAAAMAFGGVPAPALAEAASEVAAVRAQADRAGELADAVRAAALGLDGMTGADKVSSIYALLANVPVADATVTSSPSTLPSTEAAERSRVASVVPS